MDEDQRTARDDSASPELRPRTAQAQHRNEKQGSNSKTNQSDEEHRKSLRRSWRSASPITKLEVVFAGVIAACTFLYCLFAGWTLYEINSSSKDTHNLADAANKQAIHTQAIADAANKISGAADKFSASADSINRETKDAVDKFDRMAKASELSVKAVQDSSRLDQRAWVALGTVTVDHFSKTDTVAPKVTIEVGNLGKTFALNVRAECHTVLSPVELSELPEGTFSGLHSVATLFPSGRSHCILKMETALPMLNQVTDTWYLYVWADVSYEDIFRAKHVTTACSYRHAFDAEFNQCPMHNYAN